MVPDLRPVRDRAGSGRWRRQIERPGAAHRDRKGASRRGAPFPFEHGTAVGRRL